MGEARQASSPTWRRHDLLHVAPDVWASVLAHRPALADLPLLRTWADRGWPVIVRRRAEAEDPGLAPVGVPLPPAAGKHRVALLFPPDGVLRRSSPPSLRAVASVAGPGWQSTIASLLDLGAIGRCRALGLRQPAVAASDRLDLSVPTLGSRRPLAGSGRFRRPTLLFSSIAEVQRDTQLRIDGEVVFPDGSAVNWRELWNEHRTGGRAGVLAKTMEGVRLLDIASLLSVGQHA